MRGVASILVPALLLAGGAVTVALDRPAIVPVASVVKFRMAEPIILTERLN